MKERSLPSIITGALLVVVLGLYMITYQVRFNEVAVVRTFGKITEPVPRFLFPVAPELQTELDDGSVPAALRDELAQRDFTLSDEATVSVVEIDEEKEEEVERRWEVTDRERHYLVQKEKEESELRVYDADDLVTKDVKTEPGLYWKWPWPIQRVTRYDNRLQITETTGEETPTDDEKNVIVTTAVGWRINDPYRFSILHRDMTEAEEKLKTIVRTHQKTVIGQHALEQFVSAEEEKIRYDEIEGAIFQAVKRDASIDYGIKLEYVGIEKLALPKRITEDVFSAMKEERNAEAARFTSEGESKAKQIRTEAESIAGTILAFARRQADEIIAEGKKRAAEYNETFSQDEGLAIFLLQMRYLSTILKDRTTIVLDGLQSPLDVLGEAMKGPAGAAGAPAAGANATGPAVGVQVPETAEPE